MCFLGVTVMPGLRMPAGRPWEAGGETLSQELRDREIERARERATKISRNREL